MKTLTVLAELRELLDTDDVVIGGRLPPEREMARRLSCSRETLRSALAVLEDENEIWRHVGQGTFRGRRPGAAPIKENFLVQATSVEEFVNARYLIEPVVAAEAARRASAAEVRPRQRRQCVLIWTRLLKRFRPRLGRLNSLTSHRDPAIASTPQHCDMAKTRLRGRTYVVNRSLKFQFQR